MRKNIIFILTDDQGVWSLGSYGNPYAKTPVLDKMAAQGVRYENFFCASPVCSPARASILTGTVPSAHGICDWLANGSLDASQYEASNHNPYYNGETRETEYLANRMTYTDLLKKTAIHVPSWGSGIWVPAGSRSTASAAGSPHPWDFQDILMRISLWMGSFRNPAGTSPMF